MPPHPQIIATESTLLHKLTRGKDHEYPTTNRNTRILLYALQAFNYSQSFCIFLFFSHFANWNCLISLPQCVVRFCLEFTHLLSIFNLVQLPSSPIRQWLEHCCWSLSACCRLWWARSGPTLNRSRLKDACTATPAKPALRPPLPPTSPVTH